MASRSTPAPPPSRLAGPCAHPRPCCSPRCSLCSCSPQAAGARRSARAWVDGEALGWIGELHPRWQARFELPQPVVVFELDATLLQAVPVPHPGQPSRFPSVVRDLAVLVDAERPVQALLDALSAEKPAIVRSVRLFDLYQGKNLPAGRKSLAFRIVMQDTEKTLTDAEADSAIAQMIELLGQRFGATLRS